MPITTKVPLGPSTLNRKWYLDVDATPDAAEPTWIGVFGIKEFTPTVTPTTQDSSDFDSAGWGSDDVTQLKWANNGKLNRKPTVASPDEYDPGQEVIRLAAQTVGIENRVHCRWYEVNGDGGPEVEAYEGHASATWTPDGGDQTALSTVSFTLNGQGQRTAIAHPGA